MDFILEGLPDSVKDKVGKCLSAKELWENLQSIYSNKYHHIIGLEYIDHNTEYVKFRREERCSSCQTDSDEEYCEDDIVDLEE
jgi:hypothetical protein